MKIRFNVNYSDDLNDNYKYSVDFNDKYTNDGDYNLSDGNDDILVNDDDYIGEK